MANRSFNRKQALEKEVKEIYAEIAIGASGAPTLTRGTGVASISRTSAGLYVLTLQDKYSRFMWGDVKQFHATAQDITTQIKAETVATTKTVTFLCLAADVATDPASASKLFVKLELKNSSAV